MPSCSCDVTDNKSEGIDLKCSHFADALSGVELVQLSDPGADLDLQIWGVTGAQQETQTVVALIKLANSSDIVLDVEGEILDGVEVLMQVFTGHYERRGK